MLFILRCVFWLTIVFWSMSWTTGAARQPRDGLREAVAAKGTALVGAARAVVVAKLSADIADAADRRVTAMIGKTLAVHGLGASAGGTSPEPTPAWCVKSEAECGRDATRMTALVAANLDEPTDSEAALPLPPLDPRRRVVVRAMSGRID